MDTISPSSLFHLAAIVLGLAAVFGYVNLRWLKLPQTVGLVVIALFASLVTIGLDRAVPGLGFEEMIQETLRRIDFHDALMRGMLGFLLFAGALHVDLDGLYRSRWSIGVLATAGVLASTALTGLAIYGAARAVGLPLTLPWCFVFGALIAPTDPVAVLGIMKRVRVPAALETKITGESLFNDGVGVVVFTILAAVASGHGEGSGISAWRVLELFFLEAFGGALLGFAAGWAAYRMMKAIDEHNLEVLITLALVMLTYAAAERLHLSGPIAVVVAGLLIGNHGQRFAMSETTRDHVNKFWSLIDEILNAALFLIIGFEVMAVRLTGDVGLLMAAAVPVVLAARFVSVAVPITLLGLKRDFTKGAIPVLTWGGLRGGIPVALALSLPEGPVREILLAVTYGVVIFSIVVQGLTMERLIRRVIDEDQVR